MTYLKFLFYILLFLITILFESLIRIKKPKKQFDKEDHSFNKTKIAVCFSTDDNLVYPTLVSMTSVAENAGPNTYYNIYVLHPGKFDMEKNEKILKSVEKKHHKQCSVILINMTNKYEGLEFMGKRTNAPTFYRLELHNLLPKVNRAIWLDSDTMVFEDLTELIKIDMKGNYVMGFLDSMFRAMEIFGIKNATVICAGVLLLDLEALRKNNYTEKFNRFMIEEKDRITTFDQTIINAVLHDKIGKLPAKYGIWGLSEREGLIHNNVQRSWLKYNKTEYLNALYHPAIMHFVSPKPYRKTKMRFFEKWLNYANISGYYNEIYQYRENH